MMIFARNAFFATSKIPLQSQMEVYQVQLFSCSINAQNGKIRLEVKMKYILLLQKLILKKKRNSTNLHFTELVNFHSLNF